MDNVLQDGPQDATVVLTRREAERMARLLDVARVTALDVLAIEAIDTVRAALLVKLAASDEVVA